MEKTAANQWTTTLITVLATIAGTLITIRSEMPVVIGQVVKAELAVIQPRIEQHVDSVITAMDSTMVERMKVTTDSVTKKIGLIPVQISDGTRVYRPQVIVQPDTAATQAILHMLDSIGRAHQVTQETVWELVHEKEIPNGHETKWRKRRQ